MICPSCEHENDSGAALCAECGLAFLVTLDEEPENEVDVELTSIADLETNLGYSAGFLQLNDIALAASAGTLAGEDLSTLLDELLSYLQSEEKRFLSLPEVAGNPYYAGAVDRIVRGLASLRALVEEALENGAMHPADWATVLEDGMLAEGLIKKGTEELDQAEIYEKAGVGAESE